MSSWRVFHSISATSIPGLDGSVEAVRGAGFSGIRYCGLLTFRRHSLTKRYNLLQSSLAHSTYLGQSVGWNSTKWLTVIIISSFITRRSRHRHYTHFLQQLLRVAEGNSSSCLARTLYCEGMCISIDSTYLVWSLVFEESIYHRTFPYYGYTLYCLFKFERTVKQ